MYMIVLQFCILLSFAVTEIILITRGGVKNHVSTYTARTVLCSIVSFQMPFNGTEEYVNMVKRHKFLLKLDKNFLPANFRTRTHKSKFISYTLIIIYEQYYNKMSRRLRIHGLRAVDEQEINSSPKILLLADSSPYIYILIFVFYFCLPFAYTTIYRE